MKLLFTIKSLALPGGGAERVLCEVASGLAVRGHDIIVVSFDRGESSDFYPFAPPVRRVRLAIGSAVRPSGLSLTLRRIRALRREVTKLAPDAAIGFMHSAYIPLGIALAGTGVPVIASEHTVYAHYDDRRLERVLLRIIPRFLHSVTAISKEMRSDFPPPIRNKMTIIPNPVGVAAARADPTGRRGKVLLTVGRLDEHKDQRTLIAAFGLIAQRFPEWRLRIVGEGVLRPELEAQVEALGLGDRVVLPGATADIGGEYAGAQLFAMPSTYESFGLATAEAMAYGLPAIGFADCPGTNDLILDGGNGLLVSGEDRTAALASGLERLMGSEDERVRMGAAAPARIAHFSPERVVARWEEMLHRVAAGHRLPL